MLTHEAIQDLKNLNDEFTDIRSKLKYKRYSLRKSEIQALMAQSQNLDHSNLIL